MLENKGISESQRDIEAVGGIIIECLEPSTFLRKGGSLISNDWGSDILNFVESTKSQSATKILKVQISNVRIMVTLTSYSMIFFSALQAHAALSHIFALRESPSRKRQKFLKNKPLGLNSGVLLLNLVSIRNVNIILYLKFLLNQNIQILHHSVLRGVTTVEVFDLLQGDLCKVNFVAFLTTDMI